MSKATEAKQKLSSLTESVQKHSNLVKRMNCISESMKTKVNESFSSKQEDDGTWSICDNTGTVKETGLTEEDVKLKVEELNKETE